MKLAPNRLLLFNSEVLLNKKEILESFDGFIKYHKAEDNEEDYSKEKRQAIIDISERFRNLLIASEIPTISKPWFFYEYNFTNDGIELTLNKSDNDFEWDEEGYISAMSYSVERKVIEVKCEYVTVEQYAKWNSVTPTTVRQWIRRGKLRTSKKNGRDWLIPSLADRPKRGFEEATYRWDELDNNISQMFPFLANTKQIYLFQDRDDKKIFHVITGSNGDKDRQKISLTSKEREQLEIMLIASEKVEVEEQSSSITFVSGKKEFKFPELSFQNCEVSKLPFRHIVVRQHASESTCFSTDSKPGDSFDIDSNTYLIPIRWEFFGISDRSSEEGLETIFENENFSEHPKIGRVSGTLVLCDQLIADGYDPLEICDAESADLEYMMSALTDEGGPLNVQIGDPMLNVLYINELTISNDFRRKGIGSRILQEIPYLVRNMNHIMIDILTYCPIPIERNRYKETDKDSKVRKIINQRIMNTLFSDEKFDNELIAKEDAAEYQFTKDEINRYMGRRHSGSSYPEELKNTSVISFYQKNGFQELLDSRLLYTYVRL